MTIELYDHQKRALEFARPKFCYALLMEQGTGKTPVVIHDAARRWRERELNGLLVLAPNGVHANWTLRELPAHMPEDVPLVSAAWYSSPNRQESAAIDELFREHNRSALRVLTMNWEALITKEGWALAQWFANRCQYLFIAADESQRIKNPKAERTKQLFKLRPHAAVRAILSGTAVVQSPWDAFSQFGFLHPNILQTKSYTAFKAEYAELIQGNHLRHILLRGSSEADVERKMKYTQIVARDPVTGMPKWRNLDKLNALIAPHSFRVLKAECLDLPAKVYTQRYFRMSSKQRRAYDLLREELRLKLEDGTIAPVERIASLTKMSQIVSGYFIVPGTDTVQPIMDPADNPKLGVLMDELEDCATKTIVWARFRAEIVDIMRQLARAQIPAVEYHGGVSQTGRQQAIDQFQAGEARVFVGQQAAGGTGITLTAASNVIYYSNTWSLEDRLQSEDRAHRIGQRNTVRYVDILAQDSIDDHVSKALRSKTDLARTVMGDAQRLARML
jgi:SNF2 family DNA or RNA helicase